MNTDQTLEQAEITVEEAVEKAGEDTDAVALQLVDAEEAINGPYGG